MEQALYVTRHLETLAVALVQPVEQEPVRIVGVLRGDSRLARCGSLTSWMSDLLCFFDTNSELEFFFAFCADSNGILKMWPHETC